jgi:diguanylate cyclase (GGDEF)-like protein/PAS domain S-box-containing protein
MKAEKPIFDQKLQAIFDATPVAMTLSRPDGSFEYVNPAFMAMLGYTEEQVYADKLILSHPEDVQLNRSIRQRLTDNPFKPVVVEKRYLHKSGNVIPGLLTIVAQPDEQGNVLRFIAQVIDLRERKRTEESLLLFRTLVQQSSDAMFVIEAKTARFLDVNRQASESLGYSTDELLKLKVFDIETTVNNQEQWNRHIAQLRLAKKLVAEGFHQRKNGSVFPVEVSISLAVQADREYLIALARDLTERKRSEALIWQQAHFDSLTELPNRSYFTQKLQESIRAAQANQQELAIVSLDLDFFKQVNDTLGHQMGDQLLCYAAQRIKGCLRAGDTVARLGGDEFMLVLPIAEHTQEIDEIARRIVTCLVQPFELNEKQVYISASAGIAIYPRDGTQVEELMSNSDQALYSSKTDGKAQYKYFTPDMQLKANRKNWLCQELRDCKAGEQFSLVYQPIVQLKDSKTQMAEALLRWNHPTRGLINTEEFILTAEENGTIIDIGNWVFEKALADLQRYRSQLPDDFVLAINTSPRQYQRNLSQTSHWVQQLVDSRIPPSQLMVEITERVTMDINPNTNDLLKKLRNMGIKIAIDDFGTGYSCLAYLRRLNMDFLKIDKEFVGGINDNADDFALCEAMILMAHKLNLKVIAEGIENEEQARRLAAAGCDFGQGYFYSRPADIETLISNL